MIVGTEWLVEASDCKAELLRDESILRTLFERIIHELDLKPLGEVWHKFPGEGGLTGLVALSESHLACHTYPEYRTATFNLYCCRSRREWNWEENLTLALGAQTVSISKIERGSTNPKSKIQNPKSKVVGGDA
jgi:S-adenosylmethionine decarboxylase